jgi:hypothetical protein
MSPVHFVTYVPGLERPAGGISIQRQASVNRIQASVTRSRAVGVIRGFVTDPSPKGAALKQKSEGTPSHRQASLLPSAPAASQKLRDHWSRVVLEEERKVRNEQVEQFG